MTLPPTAMSPSPASRASRCHSDQMATRAPAAITNDAAPVYAARSAAAKVRYADVMSGRGAVPERCDRRYPARPRTREPPRPPLNPYTAVGSAARSRTSAPVKVEPVVPVSTTVA